MRACLVTSLVQEKAKSMRLENRGAEHFDELEYLRQRRTEMKMNSNILFVQNKMHLEQLESGINKLKITTQGGLSSGSEV